MALRPAVFDRHALALDEASFLETLAERSHVIQSFLRRLDVHEADHRHRRLLRARRERPRRRPANESDELAPPHGLSPLRPGTAPYHIIEWKAVFVHHSKIGGRLTALGQYQTLPHCKMRGCFSSKSGHTSLKD
jgi:hypothetical protein